MRTSAILKPPKSSVNFQVETFKLFGKLKSTTTEVHNSLPTIETIETEKTLMSFDEKRHAAPDHVNYSDFYRTLSSCFTPRPSRAGTARSVGLSSRSVDSRHSKLFALAPGVVNHGSRPLESRQSIVSRLSTSYTARPSESRGTDRLSMTAGNLKGSGSSYCSDESRSGRISESILEVSSEPNTQRVTVEELQPSISSRI
ncbi:hypothetical protein V1264_004140 [Littorina saxatilis]|uniref:Uncharacterized protein n=2 Tax=Littorina saxatilis TaxID=31220 RepID=A0AAN9B1F2_9CAEN